MSQCSVQNWRSCKARMPFVVFRVGQTPHDFVVGAVVVVEYAYIKVQRADAFGYVDSVTVVEYILRCQFVVCTGC